MNNSSGPGESFSTTWPDNRDNLPSYHIFLDFRLRESKQGVPQTERNLFVSRIVSAVRQARPDVHQNSATTIAVALEQKTFEKSKDKEEYRKIFHARLQQIQDSANQRRMARLRKGESVSNPSRLAEWKQEVTQTEREEFISQLTSEILLIQPNVDQGIAAATVVTSFERNALERSKDKEEYKQILQNRLQQIREVLRHREVAASQNRAREAHIERLSQQVISSSHIVASLLIIYICSNSSRINLLSNYPPPATNKPQRKIESSSCNIMYVSRI